MKKHLNEILTNKLDSTFNNTAATTANKVTVEINAANVEKAIKNNNANINSGKITLKYKDDSTNVTVSYDGKETRYTWTIDEKGGIKGPTEVTPIPTE